MIHGNKYHSIFEDNVCYYDSLIASVLNNAKPHGEIHKLNYKNLLNPEQCLMFEHGFLNNKFIKIDFQKNIQIIYFDIEHGTVVATNHLFIREMQNGCCPIYIHNIVKKQKLRDHWWYVEVEKAEY